MSGESLREESRPLIEAMRVEENRMVVGCRPTRRSPSRRGTFTAMTTKSASPIGFRARCRGMRQARPEYACI